MHVCTEPGKCHGHHSFFIAFSRVFCRVSCPLFCRLCFGRLFCQLSWQHFFVEFCVEFYVDFCVDFFVEFLVDFCVEIFVDFCVDFFVEFFWWVLPAGSWLSKSLGFLLLPSPLAFKSLFNCLRLRVMPWNNPRNNKISEYSRPRWK